MKNEQAAALKDILEKYDENTQKLYLGILNMYSNKSPRTTHSAIRNEILDMVKEATK